MKKIVLNILLLLISIHTISASANELSAFGDILIWHASQQSASTWASVVSAPSSSSIDFDATNVNFDWDVGFRGGFIFKPEHNNNDTRLYWTYFGTKTTSTLGLAEKIIAPEFFSGFISRDLFFGANIDWQIIMNMLDFDLGRKIDIGNSVTMRPAIGVKGGTIKQTINSEWNAYFYVASENLVNKFYGIGPSFAIDSTWNVFKSLSIFGDFSTAFMWGKWTINDAYTRPSALFGIITTPTTITTTLNSTKLGTMMFDYFLGVEWVHHGKSIVTIKIGYKMQFWANQLRMPTFQQLPVHGDLTLQGGTCHIRIDL